ncbi:hypothetical protein AB0L12_12130 [Streptomyces cellulosae]
MEMSFRTLPDDQHGILVRRDEGPDVRLPAQPAGPSMPHDLVHAVVETALGTDDGFWGATARGATFQGFERHPGRHRRSGMKVLRRGGDAVLDAELRVAWAYRAWSGQPTEGHGVGPALLDAEPRARTGPRLDAAAKRWTAVPVGGELVWRWGVDSWGPLRLLVTTAAPGPPPRTPAACGC